MIEIQGSKAKQSKKYKFQYCFEILKFLIVRFFRFTPLNFHHLIAETASPGPEVSVPTLGSWKYDDVICMENAKNW